MDIAHILDVPFYEIIVSDDLKPPEGLSAQRTTEFYDAGLTIALTENDELKKRYGISLISPEDEEAIMSNSYDTEILLRVYSRFELILLIKIFNSLSSEERAAAYRALKEIKDSHKKGNNTEISGQEE